MEARRRALCKYSVRVLRGVIVVLVMNLGCTEYWCLSLECILPFARQVLQ